MAVFVPSGRNKWYMKFRLEDGKQVFKSTGIAATRPKSEAEDYEQEYIERLMFGDEMLLSQAIELGHQTRWQGSKSEHTTMQRLNTILELCGNVKLSKINKQTVSGLVSKLRARGVAPATINRYLAALKTLLNMAWQDWEAIDKVPAIKLHKEPKGRTRVLTESEEGTFLDKLETYQKYGCDWSPIADLARVLIETGMRLGEALSITDKDVCFKNGTLSIHPENIKNGHPRTLPMTPRCSQAVRRQHKPGRLWPYRNYYIDSVFTKVGRMTGITGITPHVLRHTFASRMLSDGESIAVVQKWLGHRSIKMTVDRYGHLDITSLQRSIERKVSNGLQNNLRVYLGT